MSYQVRLHPTMDILCDTIGRVFLPPSGKHKGHWTFGCFNGSHKATNYLRVRISNKNYLVHRLIAETFLPNSQHYPTVDHIDRDTTNNCIENLRFASCKMQMDNQARVDSAIKSYGVRACDNKGAYMKAYCSKKRSEGFIRKRVDGKRLWVKDEV